MKFELDGTFLRSARVPLDAEDLRLGLSLGLISPPTVVDVAQAAVNAGSGDPVLEELVGIEAGDVVLIRESLRATDPEEAELFPPSSVRKWTYLELRAAYLMRDRLADPLGVVEQIYADFDYPAVVAAFVRYMPPPLGAPVGETALFVRWAAYLDAEEAALVLNGSG